MQFGVCLPNYGRGKTFDDIRRVALQAETLGYDSIWTTDHVIVPRENNDPYGNIFESITTLAMLASITQRVQLGTSILVLPQRNPVLIAKQIATIDVASGGRMIVGVGVGWNEREYRNLGMNFKNRGARLDENIQLVRALWSNDQISFHGKYTHIDDGIFSPRPQRRIPIWIGGNDVPSWERAAKFGEGWHPTGASPDVIAQGLAHIRAIAPNKNLFVSARLTIDLNPATSPTYEYLGHPRRRLSGTDDDVRQILRDYARVGLQYAVLYFPMDDLAVGLAQMERFIRELAPEFISSTLRS